MIAMSDEKLNTVIKDNDIGISKRQLTVEITARGTRKEDFEAVRKAVLKELGIDE